MTRLGEQINLEDFGAALEGVVEIDDATLDYRHLDYLDLRALSERLPRVDAVVEMAGRPVLYLVRGPLQPNVIRALSHILAQRAAADHLGIVEPGVLTVMPLIPRGERAASATEWRASDANAKDRLPGLAFGRAEDKAPGSAHTLHQELVALLIGVTRRVTNAGMSPEDALALVGRALFLRFLIDRRILTTELGPVESLGQAMGTPVSIARTNKWLDATFNGNLLPLSAPDERLFRDPVETNIVCKELSRILTKSEESGQLRFEWASLDFGHIPVGLLSQVYEGWCHAFRRDQAIRDSVWYTPRSIAEYVVDEAFYGIAKPHKARVLDPAVGAGVFLVAAYRQIISARWQHDRVRPTRSVLREVLYDQLVGFDVIEASLQLTALALYLTALELDPEPELHPTGLLRFDDLRLMGVLNNVRGPLDSEAPELPMVGSLGPHISEEHKGAYDIVLGNPPWTAWASGITSDPRVGARRRVVEEVVTPIVCNRLNDPGLTFEMVDGGPDLPFCWRALEWVRPGGAIAFALHTRLLFRQTEIGIRARRYLFSAASVTGVLNGAALTQTNVWPTHEAPFCLWFATNQLPSSEDSFNFVSPLLDKSLNKQGYFRIDPSNAIPVSQAQVIEQPWLLKTLYRGTPLDVAVMERLSSPDLSTINAYWKEHKLARSRGYQEASEKSPAHGTGEHLKDLPNLTTHDARSVLVDSDKLALFNPKPLNAERKRKDFQGPLVLFFEAPKHDLTLARALLSTKSVAYNHVFYGFSTSGHAQAKELAEYLLLVLNSKLLLYYVLMHSAMFGVERKRLHFGDAATFPFRPIEDLDKRAKRDLKDLAAGITKSGELDQAGIDGFMCRLLGLSNQEMEVVEDTLDVALPFSSSIARAQDRPSLEDVNAFVERVIEILSPVLAHFNRRIRMNVVSESGSWILLNLTSLPSDRPLVISSEVLNAIWTTACEQGSSRIVIQGARGQLLIGVFAQYRYWTKTQARRLVLDILGSPTHEPWLRGAQ